MNRDRPNDCESLWIAMNPSSVCMSCYLRLQLPTLLVDQTPRSQVLFSWSVRSWLQGMIRQNCTTCPCNPSQLDQTWTKMGGGSYMYICIYVSHAISNRLRLSPNFRASYVYMYICIYLYIYINIYIYIYGHTRIPVPQVFWSLWITRHFFWMFVWLEPFRDVRSSKINENPTRIK